MTDSDERPVIPYSLKPIKRFLWFVIFVFMTSGVLLGSGYLGLNYWAKQAGPANKPINVVIAKGGGLRQITAQLAKSGVVFAAEPLIVLATIRGDARLLKAGEYEFPAGISANGVLDTMHRGAVVLHRVTIPEGLTVKQIYALLRETPLLTGELGDFLPEGSLMPDTYQYVRDEERQAILQRMQSEMRQAIAEYWPERAKNLPFNTPEEAVTLASVVERETGVREERARVAGVFVNRLRKDMRLQADPTVIYALSNKLGVLPRPLTRADWRFDDPYNTYQNKGLPPGPIANPGRAAIKAALNPEQHRFYYFVADGDGGHAFSETYLEHNSQIEKARQKANQKP